MAVNFKKPPLNEVALGQAFLPRPDLLLPYFGRFWAKLGAQYPRCEHAAPVLDSSQSQLPVDPASGGPLPRVWFIDETGGRLVQLQQDRLVVNWRDTGDGAEYVRFPAILQQFEYARRLLDEMLREETGVPTQPARYTLHYVNTIQNGEGWHTAADVGEVFRDICWRAGPRFLPAPEHAGFRWGFSLPRELGRLDVSLAPALLTRDKSRVMKFEIVATSPGLGGTSIEFDDWVSVAHDWVVNAFKDLTQPDMHRQFWKHEES